MRGFTLVGTLAWLLSCSTSYAKWVRISDWGENPTHLDLDAYIPAELEDKPAVLLALHYCGGSGKAYHAVANFDAYAEAKGFIVAYPSTKMDDSCWDVNSNKSLTVDGGGDSTGLANMMRYFIKAYNADPMRIYVQGTSSGCMMTNVLLATYPDIFMAGSCYSGVPAGCLAGSPGSSPQSADSKCANGQNIKTGEEWAEIVRAMNPRWNGVYPRLQTFHGDGDEFVSYRNLQEQLKQWSTVQGVKFTKNVTDTPQGGYTQMLYGDGGYLVGISAHKVGHVVPVNRDADIMWFNLGSGT
ncbi:carbohydrate esterase family 1 protein [Daldinia vernicosa]|uniref:carbohydrate esterase family 1 protein n=1 Tax=Daldinia vernicosa TaxID=114800 RepID=UPI0020075982|nr:carbohydrate esterase family 1 protein [Daldinia vernicosa]KAI0850336.1 carbohydrate esterase family 1 protein [Daldinia vernicosa]